MMPSPLDSRAIHAALAEIIGGRLASGFELRLVGETGSTNDDAFALGQAGAPEGTVVMAESQSAGRGRRGDAWISPPGVNLLFSILLRPDSPIERWTRIPHLSGLAVCRAIRATFPDLPPPRLKWPNDIYVADRKLAGILVESRSQPDGRPPAAVLGIGLNVNLQTAQLPEEVRVQATTLRDQVGHLIDRNRLMAAILAEWAALYPVELEGDFAAIRDELKRISWLMGRRITLASGNRELSGEVVDLGSEGELILQGADGHRETIVTADRVSW